MTEPTSPAISTWRGAALTLYCVGSRPWRERIAREQAVRRQSRVMVFFYHRIAERADSPWTMPFATFRRQIDFLRKHFELVSFEESLRRVRLGNDTPTAHITFDDGYAENCSHALPYLIANRVPTTYFVASQHAITGKPFPHDVALGKPMPVNTVQQIIAMADAGIEIGAHTRSHADLSQIADEAALQDEIAGSKQDLEQRLGRHVRYFAFPYGTAKQLTAPAIRMCREAGFEAICSAVGGYNFPGDNPFHLQRMHGDNEMCRFKNWATMDPRKLKPQIEPPEDVESHEMQGARDEARGTRF
jgi:peptidoglycan/xylan/chitin deacetylase (PgdA/CDA1 family)